MIKKTFGRTSNRYFQWVTFSSRKLMKKKRSTRIFITNH